MFVPSCFSDFSFRTQPSVFCFVSPSFLPNSVARLIGNCKNYIVGGQEELKGPFKVTPFKIHYFINTIY